MMKIPIIGLVENYSYIKCPDCGKKLSVFGESKIDSIAAEYKLDILDKLPIDPELSKLCDSGLIELFEADYLSHTMDTVEKI